MFPNFDEHWNKVIIIMIIIIIIIIIIVVIIIITAIKEKRKRDWKNDKDDNGSSNINDFLTLQNSENEK